MGIGTPPRRRLTPAARRALIEEAALEAFATHGFHAASMSDIARRAGVTKPVLYDHFASKAALHAHLLRAQTEELLDRVARAVAGEEDPRAQMRTLVATFFAFVEERPFARRLLFDDPEAGPDVAAAHRRGQAAATRRIAAGLGAAGVLAGDPEREERLAMTAQALKAALNGLADWWLDHPDVPRERVVAHATELLGDGLLALLPEPRPT